MRVRMNKAEGNKLRLDPRDAPAFERYKAKLSDGAEVIAEFRIREDSSSERARNYFHALRDRYGAALGYDKDYAKNELCMRFGIFVPVDQIEPPDWTGHIVNMYGRLVFRKSLNEYSKDELHELIEGTIIACVENDIPIEEIVAEYRRGV